MTLDSDTLVNEWRDKKRALRKGEKVFHFGGGDSRKVWNEAKAAEGLDWLGPPHDLRHGGAARDVERKTRELEQVRRRGRWRVLSSVQRYTKTWFLVRERARLTAAQLARAADLIAKRGYPTTAA